MPINYNSLISISTLSHTFLGLMDCKEFKSSTFKNLGPQMSCTVQLTKLCKGQRFGLGTFSKIGAPCTFKLLPVKTKDKVLRYGDIVYIECQYKIKNKKLGIDHVNIKNCEQNSTKYAATFSEITTHSPTFKLTTPPGVKLVEGMEIQNGYTLSLKLHDNAKSKDWEDTFLYYDTGLFQDTKDWVWLWGATEKQAIGTSFIINVIGQNGGGFRPDPNDVNMFHAQGTDYGDKNYGTIKESCGKSPPSTPDGMKAYKRGNKQAVCSTGICVGGLSVGTKCAFGGKDHVSIAAAGCGVFNPCKCGDWDGCPQNRWIFINEWKDQTQNKKNQIECCGGVKSNSDNCHPYYYPQNINKFGINSKDGGSCPEIMKNNCILEKDKWGDPDSYISVSCDSYINQAPLDVSKNIVKNAVSKLYKKAKPSDNSPYIKKAIDLCNKFPGACDEALSSVCSKYTTKDLDSKLYSGRKYDPEGTNLLDTCGCFLNNNQYLCFDDKGNYSKDCKKEKGGMGRSCNTFCNFPNSIKPINNTTKLFDQCGGTTCAIDGITISQINSTNGAISIGQVCKSGGNPPYTCYLGNDIDLDALKGTVGNVQISQNCGECFIYDVQDPSKPPIPIECNQDINPTIKNKNIDIVDYLSIYKFPSVIVISIIILILIIILFYFQKI